MTLDSTTRKEIGYYTGLLLEGQLPEADFARFQDLLRHNSEAQDYYLGLLDINVSLRKLDWTLETLGLQNAGGFDRELWSALSATEKNAPTVEVPKPKCCPPVHKIDVPHNRQPVSRLALGAAIASMAAMLMLLGLVYFQPQSDSVAVVVDSIDAVWANSSPGLGRGDSIASGRGKYALVSGTVKIESLLGPEMIIEGPSLFEFVDMNKVAIDSGRIYVKVPPKAIGYTVTAPSFSVIDLGTEFGVSVDADGSGDVQMFSGKASLVAGAPGRTIGSHMMTEGTAKRVYAIDHQIADIPFNEDAFVRQIDSAGEIVWRGEPVNLADIVGGGNGFGTGQVGVGIEPNEGKRQAFELPPWTVMLNDGKYVQPVDNALVDGVFVPDGGNGPVQVSSSGHTFDGCPDTEGAFWMPVLNGGTIMDAVNQPQVPLQLGGREYGTASHPAIFVHSNLGITFDLDAIRKLSSAELNAFRAVCGISDTCPKRFPYADFWVLIDGKVRFSQTGVGAGKVYDINIPISSEDRYLTLMATDGGRKVCLVENGTSYPIDSDWCVFAEPYLTVKAK